MPTTDPRIDAYIAKSAEFAQPILTHSRKLVHKACPDVTETIKWSMPFFEYGGGIICNMAGFKQHCSLGFWNAPLLKDPALVVRLQAVQTVRKLRPPGAADALVATLSDRENYHGGKAQWVPVQALSALAQLGTAAHAARLRPLLDHRGDTELLSTTVRTLDQLLGAPVGAGLTLQSRVNRWKTLLSKR